MSAKKAARASKKTTRNTAKTTKPKVSRHRKPDDMSLEAWQIALRREFGQTQDFELKKVGDEQIFTDYHVSNPATARTYRVAIRGEELGMNYCSCRDYAVNTLGTCKHIEYTLARLRKQHGKRKLSAAHQPVYSEVFVRYGTRHEVVFRPGSECPAIFLSKVVSKFFEPDGRLKSDAHAKFEQFLRKARESKHEVRCYDDALAMIAQVRDADERARRIDIAFPRGADDPKPFAKLLKTSLYPYQREGALFAARTGRCLIADDMGLGKTVQAVAAAELLARIAGVERVLIVAPTSLKHQWAREIEKFTDRTVEVVEGLAPNRDQSYATDSFFKIANYDVIFRDIASIERWKPELVILDEAQRIKNWKTRTAQSIKQLESDYAIVLTGTPLENRLEELHSIVEFIDSSHLGPLFRFLAAHQHLDEDGRVVGYKNLSQVNDTLRPIMIRRTKDAVLKELPECLQKRFFVPMTEEQMRHHDENREIVGKIVSKWRRHGFLSEADQRRLTIALQRMRMACNSTYLLDQATDHGHKADELATLLDEMLEEDDTKVVIFSQWLRMHELILARTEKRRWKHVLFHGSVPGPKRKELVHDFLTDPACRLFLSTDAGGVGLNLQKASVVINVDQPWNPAVLEQRIGRVHRLGQQRPVRVVDFIAKGTIEEGMLDLLSFKKSVFAGVLDGGQDEVFLGGTRLKQFMEGIDKATSSISRQAPPLEPSESTDDLAARLAVSQQEEPASASSEEAIWGDIIKAGSALLESLSKAATSGKPDNGRPGLGSLVTRDERTGQSYLKLPLPDPDTLGKIAEMLSALVRQR